MRTTIYSSQALQPVLADVKNDNISVDIAWSFKEIVFAQINCYDAASLHLLVERSNFFRSGFLPFFLGVLCLSVN